VGLTWNVKIPTEKERFEKWERSIEFPADGVQCEQAIDQAVKRDLDRLTKWPTYIPNG